VTDSYEYDAWGNLVNKTGTTPNNYLYRGEQFDPDLGLYYLRARYYNPLTGRFLSKDPLDGIAICPKTLHKYLYASGDPVNAMDPMGRETLIEYMLKIAKPVAIIAGLAYLGRELAVAFGLIGENVEKSIGPTQHNPKEEPGQGPPGEEPPPINGPPPPPAPPLPPIEPPSEEAP
jgi:RHS repeat-associated protein